MGPVSQTVIATGAAPTVATMLTEIGKAMPTAGSPDGAAVIDVAPAAADDPRGAGFGSVVLPVFITGIALGMAAALVGRRRRVMAAVLPIGAAVVGATVVGVAMWSGVLVGGFWGQWLAMSTGILAIGALVTGVVSVIGPPGAGVAALVVMIVGMPLAGIAVPSEFLPPFWGGLGQLLPLGATGTALRSAAFFNPSGLIGAGAGMAYLVLIGWIVFGYALTLIKRKPAVAPAVAAREDLAEEPVAVS